MTARPLSCWASRHDHGRHWCGSSSETPTGSTRAPRPATAFCCAEPRLIEGAVTTNWKKALEQLALAYPDRIEPHL